jgi:hypothetical protein
MNKFSEKSYILIKKDGTVYSAWDFFKSGIAAFDTREAARSEKRFAEDAGGIRGLKIAKAKATYTVQNYVR